MSHNKTKIETNNNYTKLSTGSPSVYRLNLKETGTEHLLKKDFGNPSSLVQKNKTIIFVGATGSGKSTLINGMINYIMGVNWSDEWRFKLIDEQTNKTEAESPTSEVTAYQIHYQNDFQVPYSLTVIDTPGFGDTKGIAQDKTITEKIRQFFTDKDGILGLDAVCFVVQSCLAQLTPTQRYIFDAILSIFGKDIANNITVMITFADGHRPPVLHAINAADIPCVKKTDGSFLHFKFNNSALFAQLNHQDHDDEDNFDEVFKSNMGKASMKRFFTHLERMETKSLQLTKEVLTERKQLETTVSGVQPLMQTSLAKLDEIRMTNAALEQNRNIIKETENFEYEVDVIKYKEGDLEQGKFVTNCISCNFTCHYPCTLSDDKDKERCSAMKDGVCRVCPGRCSWNVHHNMPYKFNFITAKEKRTYANLKEKYEKALGEKMSIEKIMKQLEMEYEDVQEKVLQMSDDLAQSLTRLKEIALRPDPLTTPDYIELLIESEKQSGKEGYMKCIRELEKIKTHAVILQKVERGEELTEEEKSWKPKKTTDIHHQSKISPSKTLIENNQNYTKLSTGSPSVYRLNLKETGTKHLLKKDFGNPSSLVQNNKTIMLLGATGSGKSTLINGMINYIMGVNWSDEWRFKLIDEQTNKTQAESQTSEVTAYQIHYQNDLQVPYSLTIIDTPGFGDTKGIAQDKMITEKIRQFFSEQDGILGLDAVCFVVQSALARLTPTQKYIFDAILSIFGKDIANNITFMITFADGQRPPVLDAIDAADIPCVKEKQNKSILHFKFNNSALFAQLNNQDDEGEDNFDEMFWKMGKASMKRFFTHLERMETKSLQLTKEVLTERKQLETTVNGVQPLIQTGLAKLDEIGMTSVALEQNQNIIKDNENFEYEVDVIKYKKVDLEQRKFVTNCIGCNFTCHYPCSYSDDKDKERCSAMKKGICRVCPGQCPWNVHHNMPYRIDTITEKEKRTYANLKEKYEKALGEKMSIEEIMKQLEKEYEDVQEKVLQMTDDLAKSLTRLKEIALRSDPLTTPDYIELLIESEKQSGKEGYMKRIRELEDLKIRAVILQKVEKGELLTEEEMSQRGKPKKTFSQQIKGVFNNTLEWFKDLRL